MEGKAVRDQKVNVMQSIRPLQPEEVSHRVVRAQYAAGAVNGKSIPGYLASKGIAPNSTTDTFIAWKLEIDNWRWNGVPFYLRTGKAMPSKLTEVNIAFRKPPMRLFETLDDGMTVRSNVLTLRIQPDESISLMVDVKRPGPLITAEPVTMSFSYNSFGQPPADAYERLLLDALLGDETLFIRRDEIEVAWERVTRVLESWRQEEKIAARHDITLTLPSYAAGTWGPTEADALLGRDGRYWRNPQNERQKAVDALSL
jgi:glucose-6-phosphate 1-dehydrogenase